jgi:hypothetical protein
LLESEIAVMRKTIQTHGQQMMAARAASAPAATPGASAPTPGATPRQDHHRRQDHHLQLRHLQLRPRQRQRRPRPLQRLPVHRRHLQRVLEERCPRWSEPRPSGCACRAWWWTASEFQSASGNSGCSRSRDGADERRAFRKDRVFRRR